MTVSIEYRDSIAIIWVENPPVNAIGHVVRQGIDDALTALGTNKDVSAIILACKGRTFLSGADIMEFGKPVQEPILPDVLLHLERMQMPVIAALYGSVFGGGLETALACHYRIAAQGTKIGLPEVTLGIIPGAGGTQRLPRLIGVEAALDVIATGTPIAAEKALSLGAVDRISEGGLLEDALAFAKEVSAEYIPAPLSQRDINTPDDDSNLFDRMRATLAKKKRGFDAPQRCVDAVEAAVTKPFDEGMTFERELFVALRDGAQSRALRHMFFAEREAAKVPGLDKSQPTRDIATVGVIGAGTMGAGITLAFLNAGFAVTLVEVNEASLDRGIAHIENVTQSSVAKGRLSEEKATLIRECLTPTLSFDNLANADLIIEAVFEDITVKQNVMEKVDKVAKKGSILATNTSYLDVNQIANFTRRPSDVVGLHFFSPANIMKLLEIVRGEQTAPDVLQTCVKLSKRLGKVGVVAGVCHGFIGNRMLQGYQREAGLLILEGASPAQVDRALTNFGMAMGPMAVGDLAGLDIGYMNRQAMNPHDYEQKAFLVADRLVEEGRKGQKTSAGWYHYEEGNRKPLHDPVTDEIIAAIRAEQSVSPREITDEEIVERCIYALVNEGAKIVEEGIAYRASDIDVIYVNGYGFPRYRGGPMQYAKEAVLKNVVQSIQKYEETFGPRWWTPSDYLIQCAVGDGTW